MLPTGHRPPHVRAGRLGVWLLAAVMFLLLILPVLVLAGRTLSTSSTLPSSSNSVWQAIGISLSTTGLSVLLIIALGTPLAYVIARYQFPFKRILSTLIELPLVMPPIVAGLALLMTFGRRGLLGKPLALAGINLPFSIAAVIIAQIFVAAPFYIRTAQVHFKSTSREIEEAANIDGAGSWQVFWLITLPLSARGLLAGLVFSWTRALGEFGATILFAGNLQGRTQTMPLLVFSALESNIDAALWAGLILIGMAAFALGFTRWLEHAFEDNDSDS